tara:strand:- start:177 stop:416 length:240 start_codon:yes stop_codon:yes gene_type:complete
LGLTFFGQPASNRPAIHEEIFSLTYYGNGGFTHQEVYSMPIPLRKFYIQEIMKALDEQKKGMEKAQKGQGGVQMPQFKK